MKNNLLNFRNDLRSLDSPRLWLRNSLFKPFLKFNKLFFIKKIVLLSMINASCASYTWGTGDKKIPGGYTQVSVPLFVNLTQEVGAEVPFTRSFVKEVERSQIASLVSDADSEVFIRGTIQQLDFLGFGVVDVKDSPNERARGLNTTYHIHATVLIEVVKQSDASVVWSQSVSGTRGYNGPNLKEKSVRSANPLYNKSAREQNLIIIANELMNEAFDKMTERF